MPQTNNRPIDSPDFNQNKKGVTGGLDNSPPDCKRYFEYDCKYQNVDIFSPGSGHFVGTG